MENQIKLRKIERDQYYWKCPNCDKELKGNAESTLKHHKKLHENIYCKALKETEQ